MYKYKNIHWRRGLLMFRVKPERLRYVRYQTVPVKASVKRIYENIESS